MLQRAIRHYTQAIATGDKKAIAAAEAELHTLRLQQPILCRDRAHTLYLQAVHQREYANAITVVDHKRHMLQDAEIWATIATLIDPDIWNRPS